MSTLRTLAYPLTVKNGSLVVSEDFDTIRDAIFSVLETRPGERIMRPKFGSPDFVFDAVQHPSAVLSRIQVALEEQIPDAEFTVSGNINDAGDFSVRITWSAEQVPQPPIDLILRET
jgi:Baseplate wedge protein gp25